MYMHMLCASRGTRSGVGLALRSVALRAVSSARAPLSTLRAVPFLHVAIGIDAPCLDDERVMLRPGPEDAVYISSSTPVTTSRDWFFGEPLAVGADEGGMQLGSVKKKRKMKMNKHKRRKRIKMNRLKKRFKTK